ncbi:PKD domain-containing protein [Candidatus Marinimicrobia bacterium]|nr:PKD domain-containing protein [Candidatus Neomarinimicrobiota bacterium]MDC1021265.1 PKD domain-containing protein [Candidatus Neomarinimicrobiota bacterium]|tara:strand:- start:395 stop:5167 length:4773 start_codon:yes stop_codon:yes gene_type:complete
MKKLKYIIAFIIVGLVVFQPTKQMFENYTAEKNRLEREAFINSIAGEKINYKKMKAETRRDQRPDLRGMREYLMTYDLSTQDIPKERLIDGMSVAENRINGSRYSNRLTEVNWEERGPNNIGGRTRAILIDPSNSNKLWGAGVSGGLWYNNDITSDTEDWNLVDATWGSLAVSSITYDPNNTNIMYVGTGERMGNYSSDGSNWYSPGVSKGLGIWKTTDGGATWAQLPDCIYFSFVNDIVVRNENGTSVIYAGVGGNEFEGSYVGREFTGVWKSADGGVNWTRAFDGADAQETTGYKEFSSLDIDSNNRIWAGTRMNAYWAGGGEIFYSDDGATWTEASWKSSIGGTPNRVIISAAASDPNYIYALISNNVDNKANWIAKSTDNGTTWTELTVPTDANGNPLGDANGQAGYSMSFAVDPTDPNVLYAGEIDVFKSSDGGSSWTQITNSGGSITYMHVDQHSYEFIDGNKVIYSNDGGIYYTSNGGVQISDRNEGFNVSQFYSVALHPDTSSKYVIGGTQDNGSWKVDGTTLSNGTAIGGGDGGFSHIDQQDPNYQFIGSNYNTIYRSTNGGQSFSLYSRYQVGGADTGTLINPTGIDDGTKTIYANVDNTSILRLTNYLQLATTSLMSINLGSQASFFKASPYTDDVMYIGTTGGRIFKVTDASTTSFTATDITGSNMAGYISSIDIGASDNQILATISNYGATSVFETYGGGGSNAWNSIEGDLPDIPVRGGLYNKDNYNQVIVATDLGTWTSDDVSVSSPSWNPSNDGLANVRVDMLAKRSDGSMAAGTHGRGMFFSTGFTSTAPLNAAFTPDKTSGVFPLTISFNDRSTGSPSTWSWDFGDGTTSTDQSPSHTYTAAGKYNVSLSISDGTNSDSTTKNEIVWATAEQDILWEEGFETNPYFWADGRRDVHAFGTINSNGDADEFSWWYYTAGYGAADGSHWMAGLGMAGAGTADDWLISPTLWLRPGTDNILSFYSNMNGGSEDYDLLLSPSGGNAISDFTVVLADIDGESTASWVQQTYDLTAYAGTNVRIAMHVKTASQQYSFWDNFQLTAGQLDVAGAPLAPQGVSAEAELVYDSANDSWDPSDDGVAIFWNRNGETDLASYNVYGSLTDNFTPGSGNLLGQGTFGNINSEHFEPSSSTTPWPDTTFYFRQTFGVDSLLHDGLTQGQQWYYKVGAVDNDGNETISDQVSYLLDSEGPTAGTFTINSIVDGSYLRSTSEVTVTAADWSDNTGINYYVLGIGSSGDNTTADVVAYQNVGTSTLELTGLSLDDYTTYFIKLYAVDGSGNQSTLVINDFMTYNNLLGDYDADWDVDVEDLNAFVNAWPSAGVDTTVDIGPATGTSPYLSPSFDSLNDINDVSVFTRNWLWTKAQGKTSEPASPQKLNPVDFPAELFGNQIKITLPDNITAGRFEIVNEGNTYQFSVAKNNQSMIILENNDSLEESYEFEFGRLSPDEKELFIYIDGDASMTTVEVSYQLFSKDGAAGNGIMELGSPDEFKLYQNYPNPFSSQTTFQYDVAEATSVKIYIYNTLGQLVKTIDRGDNGIGTHTVEWDGKNEDGDTLSSGVYFYQLRTKDFNKTMKMLLVK